MAYAGVSVSDQGVGSTTASLASCGVLGLPALHRPRKQHHHKHAHQQNQKQPDQAQEQQEQQEQQQEQEKQQDQAGAGAAQAPACVESPLQRSRSLDLEERGRRRSSDSSGSRRAMPSLQVEVRPVHTCTAMAPHVAGLLPWPMPARAHTLQAHTDCRPPAAACASVALALSPYTPQTPIPHPHKR